MKKAINEMKLEFPSLAENEALARSCITSFVSRADPMPSELADIRCAVSEAVTNCVVHAYKGDAGPVYISAKIFSDRSVSIRIRDKGKGIEDIPLAMTPLYTEDPEGERSGMGFAIMQSFTDSVKVTSVRGKGTSVLMSKKMK